RLLPVFVLAALLGGPAGVATALPAGPAASLGPTVAGLPTPGARLVASPGAWSGTGEIFFDYPWYRCDSVGAHCSPLRRGTQRVRRLASGDVGHTLSLVVRANDSRGVTSAYASLVGPIAGKPVPLALTTSPSVSGDSVLGATLRVDPGRWVPKP